MDSKRPPPRRIVRVMVRLILAGASAAGALLCAEILLRVATGERYLLREPRLLTGAYAYRPGQSVRFKRPEWDVTVTIDSRGFRDEDSCARKGEKDLVVLGDSFVEGYGVTIKDTFVKRLEALYALKGAPRHVYNAGHCGTQPRQYLSTYRELFPALPHAGVILAFYVGNDLVSPGEPERIPEPDRESLEYRAKVWLGEHSGLYGLVNARVKSSATLASLFKAAGLAFAPPLLPEESVYSPAPMSEHVRYTMDLLETFSRELTAAGKSFLLVLIPTREQVSTVRWNELVARLPGGSAGRGRFALNELLAGECRRRGIAHLDLSGPFTETTGAGQSVYFELDRHWNSAGHALAARLLFEFLGR